MKIILASASPRRQELLHRLVDEFDVITSNFDESKVKLEGTIEEYVKDIALGKALDIKNKVKEDAIIIAADTIVTLDGEILGKPKDKNHAFKMLKSLQGKEHVVYTGIILINNKENLVKSETVATKVTFSELKDEEISKYIETDEPLDKAGAYGIQGVGGTFIEKIDGCYYNVVGLPLNKLRIMLKDME